jgi:hypothetical protein
MCRGIIDISVAVVFKNFVRFLIIIIGVLILIICVIVNVRIFTIEVVKKFFIID